MYEITDKLHIYGQGRVVIVGENGSGKTTLLQILQQRSGDTAGSKKNPLIQRGEDIRIGWFSQHDESLTVDERVMKWCLRMFPAGWDQEMITKKLTEANIPEEDLVKRMSELSYGQRVKIRFLQLMLDAYDLLVLDEPTNHLDIATREELEKLENSLKAYGFDEIFISHHHPDHYEFSTFLARKYKTPMLYRIWSLLFLE